MFKKYLSSLFFLAILISGLAVSLKLLGTNQEVRERAQTVAELPEEFIIPGEAIIKYKEGNTPEEIEEKVDKRNEKRSKNFLGKMQVSLEDLVIKATGDTVPETKLTQIEKAKEDLQVETTKRLTEPKDKKETQLDSIQLVKTNDETSFSEIKSRYDSVKAVEYILPNLRAEITVTPNDTLYSQMWALQKVEAEKAWDITKGSNNVTVAVIDTGIDYTHNDLGNSSSGSSFNNLVVGGYDFINNDSAPLDDNGHGTHVAGTIGALTNNGEGISGVNWNVKLLAVKVLSNSGSGGWFTIIDGIMYAANQGAKVINMSLGGGGSCSGFHVLQSAVDYARAQGTTVVVAAGNNAIDASGFIPASCNGVISVGASTRSDGRAYFSNFGPSVDIAAPGEGIISTWLQEGFNTIDGTSMASPHVAGAVALLLAKNPNLTSDQLEQLIKNNGNFISTDLPIGNRLNIFKALSAVGTTPTPTQLPTPTPTEIPLKSLAPGQSQIGSICCPNKTETWVFTGTANNIISLDVTRTAGNLFPTFSLVSPSGATETNASTPSSDKAVLNSWSLQEIGTYKVIVRDIDAGYPTESSSYTILLSTGATPSVTPTPTPTPLPTFTPTPTKIPTPTFTPPNTPTPTGTRPPGNDGDTNGDGIVDIYDYSKVVEDYGTTEKGSPADFDQDGDVDIFDFNKVIENFGKIIGKLLHFVFG